MNTEGVAEANNNKLVVSPIGFNGLFNLIIPGEGDAADGLFNLIIPGEGDAADGLFNLIIPDAGEAAAFPAWVRDTDTVDELEAYVVVNEPLPKQSVNEEVELDTEPVDNEDSTDEVEL